MSTARVAVLDVDGTLVDTNYQHALAWYRAFRDRGIVVPVWRLHRHIGMGGDQLVEAVASAVVEREHGDAVRSAQGKHYAQMLDEVEPFEGAAELLGELRRRHVRVVLASSAQPQELDHYLDLLDARQLIDAWVSAADVDSTKPAPDLVVVAIEKGGGGSAAMIGDSVWDIEAAKRAGIPTVAVRTGGFSSSELREAGAVEVYESVSALLAELRGSRSAPGTPPDRWFSAQPDRLRRA